VASADTIPLPISKHLPGKNKRPDDGLLESVAEKASTVTEDASYRSNTAWLYGIRLFNNGYYWEAHEVLEAVWNNATPNSREKHLVQGVIQIANAQRQQTDCRSSQQSALPVHTPAPGQISKRQPVIKLTAAC